MLYILIVLIFVVFKKKKINLFTFFKLIESINLLACYTLFIVARSQLRVCRERFPLRLSFWICSVKSWRVASEMRGLKGRWQVFVNLFWSSKIIQNLYYFLNKLFLFKVKIIMGFDLSKHVKFDMCYMYNRPRVDKGCLFLFLFSLSVYIWINPPPPLRLQEDRLKNINKLN